MNVLRSRPADLLPLLNCPANPQGAAREITAVGNATPFHSRLRDASQDCRIITAEHILRVGERLTRKPTRQAHG
jgi:hypothetical protein